MNKALLLLPTLALGSLLTGCVGTGPNTQEGAVTGGALGALAGAIIGNNSRGGNALGGALIGGAVGAIAGGTIGNSVDQQNGTVYGEPPPPRRVVRRYYRAEPPPPPQPYAENIPPSPAPDAVWVPGFWSFDGRAYTWVGGKWEVPPPNAHAYVPAHWEQQGDAYVYVASSWR